MPVTISLVLDTRRLKQKTATYPLKLRVIHQRVVKTYPTIFDLSEEDYRKLSAPRIGEALASVRTRAQELQRSAEQAAAALRSFDFALFEREFIHDNPLLRPRKVKTVATQLPADYFDYSPYRSRFPLFDEVHPHPTSLSARFLDYIKKLLQQGRIGSALNYLRAYRSLHAFRGNVRLEEVTAAYLHQYEQWMLARGVTKTTVGIVLRPLRAVFNEAFEEGLLHRERHYPFGRRRYQIPGARNLKKALTVEDVRRIYAYEPTDPLVCQGRDLWLFCYLANGMNVKDLLQLRYKNIQGEYLVFERAKTERTARLSARPITVYLTEDLWRIIRTYGNPEQERSTYLFPLLEPGLSLLEQFDRLNTVRRLINESMSQVRQALGLQGKVTTIVSRHTFSTHLKRAGASTEFIQEALGHTDKKTTEHYLDSFEKEVKKEYALRLTALAKEGAEPSGATQ